MALTTTPTELTTSATDLILALECLAIIYWLRRTPDKTNWRLRLWSWIFGLTTLSALLGTIAHGLQLQPSVHALLWHPLNLSLGLVISLFVAAGCGDWQGQTLAMRLLPWCIGLGLAFFVLTLLLNNEFIVFVIYEGVGMILALIIYASLAVTHRLQGATIIAAAVVLNLAAAGVQASDLSLDLGVPFDHNSLFHLLQMVAMAVLAWGLRQGDSSRSKS